MISLFTSLASSLSELGTRLARFTGLELAAFLLLAAFLELAALFELAALLVLIVLLLLAALLTLPESP